MFSMFIFKSITENIPLDLQVETEMSDSINKLWHFTNASLFAMEHCGNM